MDINALLSPDDGDVSPSSPGSGSRPVLEGPSSTNSSPQRKATRARPGPGAGRRTASSLSNEITRSPEHSTTSPPSRPLSGYGSQAFTAQEPGIANAAVPNFRPFQPTSNPAQATAAETPPPQQLRYGYTQPHHQRPVTVHRQSSTPQMETLADLASMQHRPPPPRAFSANNIRQADLVEQQRSPLAAPPISRSISRQSLADLTMAEAPAQTPPPRDFTSTALSDTESKMVMSLLSYLEQNSYAYEQHVELINLLHKGFIAHAFPSVESPGPSTPRDPYSYALLTELRQAREAMDSRFAVGEAIWVDWLSDEVILASSSEGRIAATELFSKAVQDAPASVKLWQLYIDWVSANFAACYDLEGNHRQDWSAEDNELCRELFTKDILLGVLEQAVAGTQWRIDESHIVWNRYAEFVQGEFPQSPSPTDVERLRDIFVQRLQIPHVAWNDTAQIFWPIVSRYQGQDWESLMATVNQLAEPAKRALNLRAEHEHKLQRAIQSGDENAIQSEFESYFKWERNLKNKPKHASPFDYELRCALYERALLRHPTQMDWWLDYIDFATTSSSAGPHSLLPIVERATRHCPWSGDLWGRRILRADVEKKPRDEIEATKHRATNSGLLDLGGLEEMVKMLQQWCSYLRRHAFSTINSEDDLDTAEVGIIAALENVKSEGKRLYGPDFQGDPLFRLEQTQIKFLTEGRRVNDARAIWRGLVKHLAGSFNFWSKYYNWELWLWGYDRMTEQHRVETAENGPHLATQVVQEALSQHNLDKPDMVLEMYLYHFQQHDSGDRLQEAIVHGREFSLRLAKKQARESEEAAASQQQQYASAPRTYIDGSLDDPATTKRKREDDTSVNGEISKRSKTDEDARDAYQEPSTSASAQIKRDREHNTITLKDLPLTVQELDIQKFFRDCGAILSVHLIEANDGESKSATVEFETHEDVLTAKSRNGRQLNGRPITIRSGAQNTLYVTNYPAEYDENAIRNLFKAYGEISSVRFPSLKYNSRRRFCYVNFLTYEMSHAAESAMDGTILDNVHTLVAKISNPDAAKRRSGAQAEGREVFVKNIDRNSSEFEVREFFAQFGNVTSIKLLKGVNDQPTGTGFIVYESSDQASAAVEKGNLKPFHNRVLQVTLASSKAGGATPMERAKKLDIIVKYPGPTASTSPQPSRDPDSSARRDSNVSMNSASQNDDSESYKTARARKIAIFNLPDTVNDARIRTAMEKYGALTKIQLRRDKGGAIVEYTDVKDAFNVRQGVDVSALGEDVTTGDVGDLLAKPRKDRQQESTNGNGPALVPSSALRPGTTRGGRKTGLGFKPGGAFSVIRRQTHESGTPNSRSSGAVKSNADFRSMLEQSKEAKEDEKTNEQ